MKRERRTIATAPRAIAATTPGETLRRGFEVEVVEVEDGGLDAGVGRAWITVGRSPVGVVVVESRMMVGTADVAKGVLSVTIELGRSVYESVAVEAWMSGKSLLVLVGFEVLFAWTSFMWLSPMAKRGQKLAFEGSPSGTIENVNTRLDWRSATLSSGS